MKRDRSNTPNKNELVKWAVPTQKIIKNPMGRGTVNIWNCPNAFKKTHPCKFAMCGPCYDMHVATLELMILQKDGGTVAPPIVTKRSRKSRHSPKQNKAATNVGMEGDYGNCETGHTHRDLRELHNTTDEIWVGRRRAKEKSTHNIAHHCVGCGGLF